MAVYADYIILFLLYFGATVKGDVLDVICFNQYPILDADNSGESNAGKNIFIGGYEGTGFQDATVSFARAVDTNTGAGLPDGSSMFTGTNNGLQYTRLLMPDNTGNPGMASDRIGVFQCVVDYGGVQTNITTFTMETEAWIFPVTLTKTVNIGKSTTLNVMTTLDESLLRWRRDSIPLLDTDGLSSISFENIALTDAGIYECHSSEARNGSSAYMRLIVRGCGAGLWGEDCSQYCTSCYNGGVCDEATGECVCAPGFFGDHCEGLAGSNRWGLKAEWKCSSGKLDHSDACIGRLMCLQDPFGCACPAGYTGRGCTELCDTPNTGRFGRNCEQKCHCAGGDGGCLWDTGDCTGGCETGWKGANCQVPEPCPAGFHGDYCDRCPAAVISTPHAAPGEDGEITLQWADDTVSCAVDYYTLQYELIKQDGCQDGDGTRTEPIQINSNATSYNVTGLEAYSTYTFYLLPHNVIGDGAELSFENVPTNEEVPQEFPDNVTSSVDGINSLTFTWDEIPCGNRSGDITEYHYHLVNNATNVTSVDTVLAPNISVTVTGLDPCTTYVFRVSAVTKAGMGPYSEDVTTTTNTEEPGQVGDFDVTRYLPTELSLQWTVPNSNRCPVDGYYIEYELTNEDNCNNITDPVRVSYSFVTDTNTTIEGLLPFSLYNLFVIATNDAGNSSETKLDNIETAETVPVETVEMLREGTQTTESLLFEWDEVPCGGRHGIITHYQYELYDENDEIIAKHNVTALLTNVTIKALIPCSTYTFRVAATTSEGDGPFSEFVYSNTTVEVPNVVDKLVITPNNATDLSITWLEPSDKPCPIDRYHYRVELTNLEQCEQYDMPLVVEEGFTTSTVLSLSELEPYSNYTVYIYGENEAGNGTAVNETITTQETVPESAPFTQLSSLNSRTLTYKWDEIPCGERGGEITEYRYQLRDNTGALVRNDSVVQPTVTINDLTPCSNYTFRVLAATFIGAGPFTEELRDETGIEEPDEVEDLTISPGPVATELDVSWTKPSTTPCPVDSYIVEYQIRNQDQCNTTGLPKRQDFGTFNTTYITVDDLVPYSTYEVFITARNNGGEGNETSELQTTTDVAPSQAPANVINDAKTDTSLTFAWDEIQCGYRGGDVLKYSYKLTDLDDDIIADGEVQDMTVPLTGLDPCVEYEFQVAGMTSAGNGVLNTPVTAETDFAVPGPVQFPSSSPSTSPNELFLQWGEQIINACETIVYEIEYELTNRDQCDEIPKPIRKIGDNATTTEALLTGLEPYSTYHVFIKATNQAGPGKIESIQGITNETAPSAPPQQVTYTTTSESITVSWSKPPCGYRGGDIVNYRYQFKDVSGGSNEVRDTEKESIEFTGLVPCREYQFTVRADTFVGHGPESDVLSMETSPVAPDKPTNLRASEKTETTIMLAWLEPADQPCDIIRYKIVWQAIEKPYDDDFTGNEPSLSTNTSNPFYVVEDIEPSTTYRFEVSAFNIKYWGAGPAEIIEEATLPSESLPDPIDEPLPELDTKPTKKTTKTIAIPLPEIPASYKYQNKYQIGVVPSSLSNRKRDVEVPEFGNCGADIYIAGEVDKTETEFIIGDGQKYLDLYCNPKLKTDTQYDIYVGFASRNEQEVGVVWPYEPIKQRTDPEPLLWEWLAPLVVLLTLGAFLTLAVFYTKSRKSKKGDKEAHVNKAFDNVELQTTEKPRQQEKGGKPAVATKPKVPQRSEATFAKYPDPVKINNLLDYVNNKKPGGKKWAFEDHYELLPDSQLHPWEVATQEKNRYKNRYINIIAYDNSRVVLDKLDGDPYSDYINANYIDGYKAPKKYIATQGPNSASIWDFWRMIWQESIQVIVMVTRCEEDGKVKCEQYWPEEVMKNETYCDIVVSMVSEDVKPDVTIRIFEINKMFDNEVRTIRHFHYTSWPDHGTPQYATPLLNFIKLVKTSTENITDNPIIVHCSAGVGRTGTFIAIDSLLEQAKAENKVDVFKFVMEMRQKRIKMVQTCGQYDFIFDALVEEIICGNTLLTAKEFHEKYKKLKVKEDKTKQSGLEQEYEKLQRLSKPPVSAAKRGGMDPVNVTKNRFPSRIPVDKSRPYLMTQGIDGSTNYINASYIDGYNRKDMFLATQMPLHTTVSDLWRMLYDYNSCTIVMLNPLDNTDKTMAKYWPQKGVTFHGPLAVQFVSKTEITNGIFYRTLRLTHKEKQKEPARIIRQYVYPDWPLDKDIPTNTKSMLQLINNVQAWQEEQTDGSNGKPVITVHCIDGVGVSTTFCALTSIVDRLKAEECIDVFQTVKRLRMNRFGAVSSPDQYAFLYAAVLEFIDSYSIYENFSHA